MAAEDWIYWGEDTEDEDQDVTCNRCGRSGLQRDGIWNHTTKEYDWVLIDERCQRHECPPASADEFPTEQEIRNESHKETKS